MFELKGVCDLLAETSDFIDISLSILLQAAQLVSLNVRKLSFTFIESFIIPLIFITIITTISLFIYYMIYRGTTRC